MNENEVTQNQPRTSCVLDIVIVEGEGDGYWSLNRRKKNVTIKKMMRGAARISV